MGYQDETRSGNLKALAGAALLAAFTVAAAEVTSVQLFDEGAEAEVTATLVADALERKALRPCDITVAQFGPGERWYSHHHIYECASAAREVPNHILSYPLEVQ